MMQFVDLHIHSKYSRACSKNISLQTLSENAKTKGLTVLGTGDFAHPEWNKELKNNLSESGGIYEYNNMKFILSNEISLMYKQGGKGRRIHHILLAPDFEISDQIIEFLGSKGRLDYDGRPIFGFSSIELVENMMSISKDIMVIPAHAWTPWFGIFGSFSGFDSLKECFGEKTKYINAIETGLSSDPSMNWRLSELDNISLVSFSDAHSYYPHRIGRECCVFDVNPTYEDITNSIKTRKNFLYTMEFFPEEGKYHYDGHRNCNFSCRPEETKRLKNKCPKCGNSLTVGVLSRVDQLADRHEGFVPKNPVRYKSMVPLSELISSVTGTGVFTKKVWSIYSLLIENFGSEFNIMFSAEPKTLSKIVDEKITSAIIKSRLGKIKMKPGYDGVYGELVIDNKESVDEKGLKKFF
jgi:uncharacterized protein (TIGR00375 family)